MNKHFKKVLAVLKTKGKALGFSKSEMKRIAAKVADKLELDDDASDDDVQSAVEDAVDEAIELLEFSQSAAQRAISNYKKKHNISDDDDDDPDDGDDLDDDPDANKGGKKSRQQRQKSNNKSNDDNDVDDAPAWAKSLMASMEKMGERVSSLEKGNTSESRRAKLQAILKDTGKYGERKLKEFDRIKDTFKDEDDFEDYLDEVSEDLEAYNQERADEGLSKLGVPGASTPHKKNKDDEGDEPEKLSDEEIEDLANEF